MEGILVWLLRIALFTMGAAAAIGIVRWIREALRERRERWAVRIGLGMVLLAGVYAVGHARLLWQGEEIEAARMRYAIYGDPRLTELRRAEVRGWLLDCTGEDEDALARYEEANGVVRRVYPLGAAGANLIGGGEEPEARDFTVERLYVELLREPRSFGEWGAIHPAGQDLRLTLCSAPTQRAWELLRESGRPGAVIVQDVNTGAVIAYAATGGAEEAPLGIKQYAPPGSIFKLALAALWWESDLPEDAPIPCPPRLEVTERAVISNAGGVGYGVVEGPAGVLVPSCNTAAVTMALRLREELGSEAFVEAYRRFGFTPYQEEVPEGEETEFWAASVDRWKERMSPPPARIRIGEETGRAEWAQLAIGQGPIDVTPIHVSRFLQAIGNDGVMLPPTIEWDEAEDPVEGERVMEEETAERLQAAMREVVERGTARGVAPLLRGVDWSLGGKTGTAQVAGAADEGWFAGLVFGPEEEPRYAVTVYLRGGGPGGARPAAIAAQMTRFFARWNPEEE